MWLAEGMMINHYTFPLYIHFIQAIYTYNMCAYEVCIHPNCMRIHDRVFQFCRYKRALAICSAGGKQCGLSWGRCRLKVPDEDVILSESAHRDAKTHRRRTHSLPHWFKCHRQCDKLQQFTTFPIFSFAFSAYICRAMRLRRLTRDKRLESQTFATKASIQ